MNVYKKEVLYLQPSALKHHYNEHNVFEMWEGETQRMVIKPSEDINAGSTLCIVTYRGFYAEVGYNLLGQTYDEWNIPDGFVAYDIFHAFCAKSGYNARAG